MGGRLRVALALAVVVICGLVATGCGSAATTSPAEARAVAVAEARFLKEWGDAYHLGVRRCKGLSDEAGLKCLHQVEYRPQGRALSRFTDSIETILGEGVGPECAASLEDAQASMLSVPSFAGSTSFTCRQESRQAS